MNIQKFAAFPCIQDMISKLAPTERSEINISHGLLRISGCLDYPEDRIADLKQALN